MILSEVEIELLSSYFGIHESEKDYELEQWTNGGVDMIIYLNKESDQPFVKQFEEYIDNFNIDEEIDLYREGKDYRNAFSIRESVIDFEEWEKYCKSILEQWNIIYRINKKMNEANITLLNNYNFNQFCNNKDKYQCVATIEGKFITVCDNTTGDGWTEDFLLSDYYYAIAWGTKKIEIADYYGVLRDRKREQELETKEELVI